MNDDGKTMRPFLWISVTKAFRFLELEVVVGAKVPQVHGAEASSEPPAAAHQQRKHSNFGSFHQTRSTLNIWSRFH